MRVKLKRPTPAALDYFALVIPIYPKAYREKVGAGRLRQGAGRRRPVQDDQGRARRLDRLRTLRGLLGRQPEGQTRDQAAERALRAGRHDRDDRAARAARRLDLEHESGPVRQHQQDPDLHGRAQGVDAGRLSVARCRRPHRRGQSGHQAESAPGDLARDRPQGDRRQAGHRRQPRSGGAVLPAAVRLRCGSRRALRLRSRQGEAASRRGRLSQRLRSRADELCAAAVGRGGAELSAGGRHPRQAQPAAGRGADPARQGRRAALVSRKLGQLLDQRRVGVHAELLRRRRRRLRARSRRDQVAGRGRIVERSGGAQEGLFVRDPAHHRAGLLRAAAHLCDDLRLFEDARLHAVRRRAAALLSWRSGSSSVAGGSSA